MKLVKGWAGCLVDADDPQNKKCSICTEWFIRVAMPCASYCSKCWSHYGKWRRELLKIEKGAATFVYHDLTVLAFRELYTEGMLRPMVPWTWPGETEVPRGAIGTAMEGVLAPSRRRWQD